MKGKVCGDFCEFTLDKGHFITGEIVKTHKYWAVGALACMVATFYTGFRGKMKEHKIFAIGAMGCMLFSVLSGYKMISGKGAVKKSEEVEKN